MGLRILKNPARKVKCRAQSWCYNHGLMRKRDGEYFQLCIDAFIAGHKSGYKDRKNEK